MKKRLSITLTILISSLAISCGGGGSDPDPQHKCNECECWEVEPRWEEEKIWINNPAYNKVYSVLAIENIHYYHSYNGHSEIIQIEENMDPKQEGDTWLKQFTFILGGEKPNPSDSEFISKDLEVKFYDGTSLENYRQIYPIPNEKLENNNFYVTLDENFNPQLFLRTTALRPTCTFTVYEDHYEVWASGYSGTPINYEEEFHIEEKISVPTSQVPYGVGEEVPNPAYDLVFQEIYPAQTIEYDYLDQDSRVEVSTGYPDTKESGDTWLYQYRDTISIYSVDYSIQEGTTFRFFANGWEIFPLVNEKLGKKNNFQLVIDEYDALPRLMVRNTIASSVDLIVTIYEDHYEVYLGGYTGGDIDYSNELHIDETTRDSFLYKEKSYYDGFIQTPPTTQLNPTYEMVTCGKIDPLDTIKFVSNKSEQIDEYTSFDGEVDGTIETNPEYDEETNNEVWRAKRSFTLSGQYLFYSWVYPLYAIRFVHVDSNDNSKNVYPIPRTENVYNIFRAEIITPYNYWGEPDGDPEPLVFVRAGDVKTVNATLYYFDDHLEIDGTAYMSTGNEAKTFDELVDWASEPQVNKYILVYSEAPADNRLIRCRVTKKRRVWKDSDYKTPRVKETGTYITDRIDVVEYFKWYFTQDQVEYDNPGYFQYALNFYYELELDGSGYATLSRRGYEADGSKAAYAAWSYRGKFCVKDDFYYLDLNTNQINYHQYATMDINVFDFKDPNTGRQLAEFTIPNLKQFFDIHKVIRLYFKLGKNNYIHGFGEILKLENNYCTALHQEAYDFVKDLSVIPPVEFAYSFIYWAMY